MLSLAQAAQHHLGHVLRRGPRDPVLLFNGRDGEFLAEIVLMTKKEATIRVGNRQRNQTREPDLMLCFAPLKKEATDFLVEKATELGVTLFQPVATRHTTATRVNAERLRQNAIMAAQQCGRLSVPAIASVLPLEQLFDDWPVDRRMLVCAERGRAAPIRDVLNGFTDVVTSANRWAILCGPEGGFDLAELDRMAELPFVSLVGLGPRVLRADTAALAALAVFQSHVGDGELRPPERPVGNLESGER